MSSTVEKLAIVISGVDSTASMFERVSKNIGGMSSKAKELSDAGKHWQVWGARLNKIGTAASWGATALGGLIAPAISKVASAQDSFNMVQNLTGKTAEEMKTFRAQIYKIASETGQASEDLLAAATTKIRRGMSESDIFETLKLEGKYATATHSKNLAQISDATYTFSRQMKMSVKEASNAFAGVMHISKNGMLDFDGLMGSATSMLGEASSMGVAREKGIMQILAAAQIAAKDTNIGADGAAASVQSLFADMKTAKQDKALEAAGLGGLQERAEQSGNYISTVVQEVMAKTGGNEVELAKIFKSASTRNLIRTLSDDLKKGKDAEYEALWRAAEAVDDSALQKDFGNATRSISQQWKDFQNQTTQLADSKFTPWLQRITDLMGWLNKDSFAAKMTMGGFMTLFATGGAIKAVNFFMPVIGGALKAKKATTDAISAIRGLSKMSGSLSSGFAAWARLQFPNLTGALGDIRDALKKASTATWGFVRALWAKSAAWLKTSAMSAGGFLGKIAGGFKTAGIATWGMVKALIAQAAAWAMTPIGMITIAVTALVAGAIAIWKNWDKLVAWFKTAWAWLKGLWQKMPGWMQWLFPLIKIPTLIVQNWSKITGFFSAIWNGIKSFFGKIWSGVTGVFSKVWGFMTGLHAKFRNAGINIIKNIWEGIKGMVSKPIQAIKDMVGKIRKFLPFSPAKEGPLKDIHRIRFIETIAEGMKPGPLLSKVTNVFGKVKTALPSAIAMTAQLATAPIALAAKPVMQPQNSAIFKATAPPQGQASAVRSQGRAPIQITINIDARAAAPGVEQNIRKAIMDNIPQIERALAQSAERAARIRHI